VPVGHTKETLLSSIKASVRTYPINKVVLVLGINKDEKSERRARKIADEVEKGLEIILCERMYTDLFDVLTATNDLVIKAKNEKKSGNKVVFNISGSLRTVDIAAYIASVITKSISIVGVPEYKNDNIVGVKEVYEVPNIPASGLSDVKLSVLALLDKENWKSLNEISENFDKTSNIKLDSKKSKMSFHLDDLKRLKLVETKKDNKILLVRLSKLGLAYYNGLKPERLH